MLTIIPHRCSGTTVVNWEWYGGHLNVGTVVLEAIPARHQGVVTYKGAGRGRGFASPRVINNSVVDTGIEHCNTAAVITLHINYQNNTTVLINSNGLFTMKL